MADGKAQADGRELGRFDGELPGQFAFIGDTIVVAALALIGDAVEVAIEGDSIRQIAHIENAVDVAVKLRAN